MCACMYTHMHTSTHAKVYTYVVSLDAPWHCARPYSQATSVKQEWAILQMKKLRAGNISWLPGVT